MKPHPGDVSDAGAGVALQFGGIGPIGLTIK